MNSQNHVSVVGLGVTAVSVLEPHSLCDDCKQDEMNYSSSNWINKFRTKANYHVKGIRDTVVNLQLKISQTVRRKLIWTERVFRKTFPVGEREKLVKYSRCFLSTTAGPIAGVLFISTEKIAFFSNRSLTLTSDNGEVARFRYKVVIPLIKIKSAIPIENFEKPSKKYIQVVTVDGFDFWFLGFVTYEKFISKLQQAATYAVSGF